MSSPGPPPSSLPPSMGPGARSMQPDQSSPGAGIREVMDIRKTYNVNVDSNRLNLSYELDNQTRSYSLPFENMPIGGIAQTICYGSTSSKVSGIFVIDAIRGAENVTGQQLSQSEAEGFAKHATKRVEYGVFGNLVGLAGAYGLAYAGRKEMRFPFMKPKDPERYLKFPNRYVPILQGNWARLMWQITRANVYAFIGLMAAGPLFSSMGDVSMMVGLYKDGRTQSVLKRIKEKGGLDRIASNRKRPGQSKAQPQVQPVAGDIIPQDDYQRSDYGGIDAYSGDGAFTDGMTDHSSMSDTTATQREVEKAQQASPRRLQPARQQAQSQAQQPSSSSDFFFDDASPTAGNDPDMATSTPYKRRASGESAWARIRQGNPRPGQKDYSGQQMTEPNIAYGISETTKVAREPNGMLQDAEQQRNNEMQTKGDSFAFSTSDRDRELAKQQAQKEFNAMLERERNESGSGDYGSGFKASGNGSEELRSGGSAWDRKRGGRSL